MRKAGVILALILIVVSSGVMVCKDFSFISLSDLCDDKSKAGNYDVLIIDGEIEGIYLTEDSLVKKYVEFRKFPMVLFTIDSVRMLDGHRFPEVYGLWKQMAAKGFHERGIVQYYSKEYDEDGALVDEGWSCAFLEEKNYFNWYVDYMDIGNWITYKDGLKKRVTNRTPGAIEIMHNILESIDRGEQEIE